MTGVLAGAMPGERGFQFIEPENEPVYEERKVVPPKKGRHTAALKNISSPAMTGISSVDYQPSRYAKISGATIVASDSITNLGVWISSLPQVIFSLGTAPEYEP